MPDRALRHRLLSGMATRTPRLGPNASNARQGIKTVLPDEFPTTVSAVQTPPMPDRALRRREWAWETLTRAQDVQTPPMPDRALRPRTPGHPGGPGRIGPNASNARQGIKTNAAAERDSEPRLRPNASNARQGIKTQARGGKFRKRVHVRPNASNARQGIKTTWSGGPKKCWR